jgi:hypothetical protein
VFRIRAGNNEFGVAGQRLVLAMEHRAGNIWMLDNVDK